MKRKISALAILLCLCFSFSFLLRGQNFSDPDPEINQLIEDFARGRMNHTDIYNFRSKLKSINSLKEDIGNPPEWSWVRTFGGSGGIIVNDVALDGSNNFYILATFSDTIKVLSHYFISQGMRDVIVIKVSNLGTYVWGSQLKSSVEQSIYGKSLTLGTGGNLYISGNLGTTSVTGGSITKIKDEEERIFIAALNSSGDFIWLNFNKESESIELHTDGKGDIYWMTSSVLFKLNSTGNIIREKEIGGSLIDFKISGENIWVTGFADDPGIVIAGEVFNPLYTSYAVFLVEMDTAGNYLQRKFLETSYNYEEYYSPASLELDSKGNIYLSGFLFDVYINGSYIVNPSGSYLYKLNNNLQLVWALNDDSGNISACKFTKGSDNRFYEYGEYYISKYYDSVKIGNIIVFPDPGVRYGYYLAEVDSSGNVLSLKTFPEISENFIVKSPDILYRIFTDYYSVGFEKATLDGAQFWKHEIENTGGEASFWYTMDIDNDGNLYAQGYYSGCIRIINKTLKGTGIIFVKFDNDGNLEWWRNMENPDGVSSGIRVDKDGNVYAWGTFNGYIKILDQEYESESGIDIYFIKFDKDGELKFVKQFEGTNYIAGTGAIDVDNAGDIIIAGTYTDTLQLGSYKLISYKQTYDVFLAKFDPNGNVIWARSYKGKSSDWGRSVTVDERDNIYFTGYYRDSITFDKEVLKKNVSGYDMYVVKLDPKANVLWAKAGGPDNRYVRGISIVVRDKNLYVQGVGASTGPLYFDSGNTSLMSEFANNSFLARFDTDGNMKWVKLMKANKYNWPMYRIDVDTAEDVYIGGVFEDTLEVEGNLIPGSEGYNYYIAKFNQDGNIKWLKTSEQSNTGDVQLISLRVFDKDIVLVAGRVSNGIVQVGNQRIVTAGTYSFAGLIGKAIIGCVIDLKMDIVNTLHGDSTGSAQVFITGGTSPYNITWSNGQKDYDMDTNTAVIAKQPAGIYQVYVEDAKGCIQYREFAINDLNGPIITEDSIHDVSCNGYADGFINISISGGTPFTGESPYRYYWSNGMKTEDIKDLVAAPYEIQVEDANGYVAYQGFMVSEPKPIDITYDLFPASCNGGTDGRINLFVSGGTKPYTYKWTGDWTTDDLVGISAGIWEVKITDNNNCTSSTKIALSEDNSPIVETDTIINAHCNQSDGYVTINTLDSIGYLSYKWNTGETTPELSGVGEGDYFVIVKNEAGCKTVHKVAVGLVPPPGNPICLVTVDTATETNLVVWEKVENTEMYYVFRETTEKDKYILAGSVPGDALSVFTDSIADPHVRSYRYKIAAVDACGSASILSTLHKTVHLKVYPELNTDNIILIWDDYVGEDVASFEVWRYSSVFKWELLETMPSDLYSYIDINVPPGKVLYNVRVPIPEPCYPTENGKAGTGPYSHSMSNIEDNRFQTGVNEISTNPGIYVYPNPTSGKFYLWSESVRLENPEIQVLDLQGRVIRDEKHVDNSDGKIIMDLTGQAQGSYIIKVRSGDYIMFGKLIIQ
jgi:hypothetical protein